MNWHKLLSPENGGPGEPPGRGEAVASAKAATERRHALKAKVRELKAKKKGRRG